MAVDSISIGIGVIGLLQAANLTWTICVNKKLDGMVSDKLCHERRDHDDKKVRIVERKMDNHVHNGGGEVKYLPYET